MTSFGVRWQPLSYAKRDSLEASETSDFGMSLSSDMKLLLYAKAIKYCCGFLN